MSSARRRPAPRGARGPLVLLAVVLFAGTAGFTLWLLLRDAIETRGKAPPAFAPEGTVAAAESLARQTGPRPDGGAASTTSAPGAPAVRGGSSPSP